MDIAFRCKVQGVIFILIGLFVACDAQTSDEPEACTKVFGGDKLNTDTARTFSVRDLITVEKCGFGYHPSISFYPEIMESAEYQVPVLLDELRIAEDEHWRAHLIYLIKAVIGKGKFKHFVERDASPIMRQVDDAFGKARKESSAYEKIHDLRDGIYFLLEGGSDSSRASPSLEVAS